MFIFLFVKINISKRFTKRLTKTVWLKYIQIRCFIYSKLQKLFYSLWILYNQNSFYIFSGKKEYKNNIK